MHARIIAVGEKMPPWVASGFKDYYKRIGRDFPLELVEIRPGRRGKGADIKRAMQTESAQVLKHIPAHSRIIALDERGVEWTSARLAKKLGDWKMLGDDLAFVIGGPDGHDRALFAQAEERWSLGKLTLPHMMVRLIVIEQIYRGLSILAGHPYHRA